VLVLAAAFGGMVIAQTRENRPASPRVANPQSASPQSGLPDGQITRVNARPDAPPVGATKLGTADHDNSVDIMPASMATWAGPFTSDELHQVPRKLTPEERNLLRQEIKTAGEEVYEPYRNKKH
jgi:hypothetical protein